MTITITGAYTMDTYILIGFVTTVILGAFITWYVSYKSTKDLWKQNSQEHLELTKAVKDGSENLSELNKRISAHLSLV